MVDVYYQVAEHAVLDTIVARSVVGYINTDSICYEKHQLSHDIYK